MIIISGQTTNYGLGQLIISWDALPIGAMVSIEAPTIESSDIISLKESRTVQQLKSRYFVIQLKSKYQIQSEGFD